MTQEIKPVDWSLAAVWNAVAKKEDRPPQKRSYCFASEIGGSYIDRFLKMKGTPYTNPPNDRSLRKFLSGNIMEYLIKGVLIVSGFYHKEEVKIDAAPYSDTLSVHGRLDFKTISGYVDIPAAKERLANAGYPEYLIVIGNAIIESLEGIYLKEKILEIKSTSSFSFDRVDKANAPMAHHTLQGYHYQKNGGIDVNIIYCNKDDMRLRQFGLNAEESEKLYRDDLVEMTYYFEKDQLPPPEKHVKFDADVAKFSKNYKVEYSQYLHKIYGFATPEDFRNSVNYVESWNRALTRIAQCELGMKTPTGKPMTVTPGNKKYMAAIEDAGYNFNDLLEARIRVGGFDETETE